MSLCSPLPFGISSQDNADYSCLLEKSLLLRLLWHHTSIISPPQHSFSVLFAGSFISVLSSNVGNSEVLTSVFSSPPSPCLFGDHVNSHDITIIDKYMTLSSSSKAFPSYSFLHKLLTKHLLLAVPWTPQTQYIQVEIICHLPSLLSLYYLVGWHQESNKEAWSHFFLKIKK